MIKSIIIFYLCTPDKGNETARSASSDEKHQLVSIQYLIFWWWTGLLPEVRSPWLCWPWWWRSTWFQDTGQRTGNGFHFPAWKLFRFGWINQFLGQRSWLLCRWSAKGKRTWRWLQRRQMLTSSLANTPSDGGRGRRASDLSGETLRRLDASGLESSDDAEEPSPNFRVVCYCLVGGT